MNKFITLIFIFQSISCLGQFFLYQDLISGGVTVGGVSTGLALNYQNAEITVDLTQADSISKAYLIYYSSTNFPFDTLKFNGDNYFEDENIKISEYQVPFTNGETDKIKTNYIDVTQSVHIFQNTYNFSISNTNFDVISSFLLYVVYFRNSSSTIATTLMINNQNLAPENIYNFNNISKKNVNSPLSLSLHTDILWDTITDGTFVDVNDNFIGLIGGSDVNNSGFIGAGVLGSYNYFDGILSGLSDDTSDSLMSGPDALADIKSYSDDQINLKLTTQSINNVYNNYISFSVAYSTPCQPQNVTVTPDTTICPNTQVQLSATGGTSSGSTPAYEWWPQKDLSCYDCPNPIFSGDSSQLYTVRIWGSDSCSVVRPIMIHVRTKPKTTLYNQSNSLCADSTAFVNWQTAGSNTYSLDNGAFQPAGFYNQLPAGEHLLTVRDAFGCSYDTLVLIDDYSSVNAGLSVSPLSGEAPLVVQITNQSTEFTDYSWSVNNTIQPNASNSFQAFTAGEYIIQLIAWQNDPTCADTAFQTISVSSTGFYIYGSSLVSASSNTQNSFSVLTNGAPIVKVNLYDAQGRLLKTKTNLQLNAGSNTIWSVSELSDIASEMVLYRIEWQNGGESGELKGKVLVVR